MSMRSPTYFTCWPVLFLLIGLVGAPPTGVAQLANWFPLAQRLDVQAYQEKPFRFSGAVKVVPERSFGKAALWVQVECLDGSAGLDMHQIASSLLDQTWSFYTIAGTLDRDARWLSVGATCHQGGYVLFDAFQLDIEINPGQWETVPLVNGGFEDWIGDGFPEGWQSGFRCMSIFTPLECRTDVFEGRSALKITAEGLSFHEASPYHACGSVEAPPTYLQADQGGRAQHKNVPR